MKFALILCLAVIFDSAFGDPQNFPHPVRFIGHVITFWHKILFTGNDSFLRGLAVCVMTIFTAGLVVCAVIHVSGGNVIVQAYIVYSALAWRDLKDETAPVFFALMNHDINGARRALSFVVGRDTANLDEAGITKAVIETIGENSIDGAISVIFFAALGHVLNYDCGMCVAVWVFRAANTLDSMLGYRSYGRYGTASARLDDILGFIPARLGGIIIIMAGTLLGGKFREACRVFMSCRLNHDSPNSAHGESAFAGVLGVRLGGGAFYGGKFEARPFLNENANDPAILDIVRAWKVFDVACSLAAIMVIFLIWTI
ncbi:MAG: cobalamin biosynthesis protein CobD [Synergistaceae bacterium]|nr:cobalamin biosynthesis protein CobD [Synergistaceae bacterium]